MVRKFLMLQTTPWSNKLSTHKRDVAVFRNSFMLSNVKQPIFVVGQLEKKGWQIRTAISHDYQDPFARDKVQLDDAG